MLARYHPQRSEKWSEARGCLVAAGTAAAAVAVTVAVGARLTRAASDSCQILPGV